MSTESSKDVNFRMPREVYVCAIIEFLATLGGAINSIPSTRLIENAVCQRHFFTSEPIAEHVCKESGIQTELANLLGAMGSFNSLPGLLLTIPYGVLSEHVDRRYIMLLNAASSTGALVYTILICTSSQLDLRLLWLGGLFECFGGGGNVFQMLLRTIIAEAVPSTHLSKILYRLSAMNLLVRLLGVSLGSWLSRLGPSNAMLIGISVFSVILPTITYLPETWTNRLPTATDSMELTYVSLNQDPDLSPSELPVKKIKRLHQTLHKEITGSFKSLFHLICYNRTFKTYLTIMFFNNIALGARGLVRPWLSKRYDWTLEFTGYMLSLESILSVAMFTLLQYLDSKPASTSNPLKKRKSELKTSKLSLLAAIIGSIILGFATKPWMFFTSTVVLSCSVGFIDALRAFFTSRIEKEDIGKLYSAVFVVDTLANTISSPAWSAIYGFGYAIGGVWDGMPFWISAGMMVGVGVLVQRLRIN